ncbi:properdin [Molothrus aeneus]|uniref:properdin n=1 Tax=Molothrus aeneus TaxID=84833 RepID=UPI003459ADE1
MAAPGLLLALGLLLIGTAAHGAATPVWCFSRLEEDGEGGACTEPLGEELLPLADCCLNPAYGYRLRPHGHCRSCRPGAWGPWEPWSSCSVTCDEGTQRRGRSRGHGGGHAGNSTEWQLRACDMGCCPDVGIWGPWSPWGPCSVTCGGGGAQRRHRSCSSPAPQCGATCGPGDSEDTRECEGTMKICPVAGAWGPWGPWGPCSGSCRGSGPGPGRSRRRRCDSPEPSREPPGAPCPGSGTDSEPCPGLPPCPVHGAWGAWSPATPCPVTCGLGGVVQRRSCDAPSPKYGGRDCEGPQSRRGLCGPRDPCPALVLWGPWGPWSPCQRPWGDISCSAAVGQQKRTRDCEGHSPGGAACPTDQGGSIELRACYSVQNCPLRGNWSDWSPWGLCTPPCGANPTRSRSRECRPSLPQYPLSVPRVGSPGQVPVSFWGVPRSLCAPLEGQRRRLEETKPCRNVRPCPHPEEEDDSR